MGAATSPGRTTPEPGRARRASARHLYSRLRTLLTVTDISDLAPELALLAGLADGPEDVPLEIASGAPRVSLRAIDTDTRPRPATSTGTGCRRSSNCSGESASSSSSDRPVPARPTLQRSSPSTSSATSRATTVSSSSTPRTPTRTSSRGSVPSSMPTAAWSTSSGPDRSSSSPTRRGPTPGEPYLLIVDEINRGNLAKIFGELYYLLEYRERSIVLQYGGGGRRRVQPADEPVPDRHDEHGRSLHRARRRRDSATLRLRPSSVHSSDRSAICCAPGSVGRVGTIDPRVCSTS